MKPQHECILRTVSSIAESAQMFQPDELAVIVGGIWKSIHVLSYVNVLWLVVEGRSPSCCWSTLLVSEK